MTPELEDYFNTFFELFSRKGWKQFKKEVEENAKVINSVEATKDANDLYFRKGQLNIMANILNFDASIEQAHKSASEDAEEITEE